MKLLDSLIKQLKDKLARREHNILALAKHGRERRQKLESGVWWVVVHVNLLPSVWNYAEMQRVF